MFKEYLDFRIQIDQPNDSGYPISVHAPGGDAREMLVPPTGHPAYLQLAEQIAGANADEAALSQAGQLLFQSLFTGTVRDVYLRSQGLLRDNQGLRLTFEIAAGQHEIAMLPWELLADPDRGPLAILDMPVVRYLPQPLTTPALALPQRIAVLLTAAQPDRDTDAIAAELAEVEAALGALGAQVQIVVERHLTKTILQRHLREHFHIWHFVGSSGFTQDGATGWLAFEDAAGALDKVAASELAILLHRTSVQLAVLSAGATAQLTSNPLRSVGPALIRAQVPAVVVMQQAVPAPVTHAFAAELYRTLAEGFPIDACVTEGRKAVMNALGVEHPYWSFPVIYTRAPTGRLFVPRSDMPPTPRALPEGAALVGRADDLAYYREKLASRHLAVITGMPGVGKTALGAALARQLNRPDKTFWYSFQEQASIDRCVHKLIEFLAWDGQDELWRQIKRAGRSAEPLPSTDELIDHVVPLLCGKAYLLCLDDFQYAEDGDAATQHFIRQLCEAALAGQLNVIITAWRSPEIVLQYQEFKPLQGLPPDAIGALFASERYQVALSPDVILTLHEVTAGNAQFVTLAANTLRDGADPAQLIDELMQTGGNTQQLAIILSSRVDALLSPDQRTVMQALAILDGAASASAIEATLDTSTSVQPPLLDLLSCGLLNTSKRMGKPEYGQHAFLRTFYYSRLSERDRLAMHRRAGSYFAADRPSKLKAAQQFLRGEDYTRAARLASSDLWQIINQGQARQLLTFLRSFDSDQLAPEDWSAICTALGEVYALLGGLTAAHEQFEQALQYGTALEYGSGTADSLASTAAQARRYRLLALVNERNGMLDQAEASCDKGLALIAGLPLPNIEAARLHAQRADIALRRGALDQAQSACVTGLAALPPEPAAPRERGTLLQRMATLDGQRGKYAAAIGDLERSLAVARQTGDLALIAQVLQNLGLYYQRVGKVDQALRCYQESLRLKEHIGDTPERVRTLINLGNLHRDRGDKAAALHCYQECKNLSLQLNKPETLASVTINLGLIHYEQRLVDQAQASFHLNKARDSFQQACAIFRSLDDALNTADSLYRLGDAALSEGQSAAAQGYAEQALALAEAAGSDAYRSCALRVLGEALVAQQQLPAAANALERAWQIRVDDHFDQALIKAALARFWLVCGDHTMAKLHIQDGLALAQQHGSPYIVQLVQQLQAEIGLGDDDKIKG